MLKRIITGIILVAFFLWALLKAPSIVLWGVLLGLLLLSAFEWRRLIEPNVALLRQGLYAVMSGILMALVCLNHLLDKLVVVGAFLPLLALLDLKRYPKKLPIGKSASGIGYLLGWVLLLPFFSSLTYLLFFEVFGREWLLVGIAIVCLSDTGAYFMGRWIGKHKLAPHISPGKTWEGVLGAFLAPSLALGIASLFDWSGSGVSLFHWFIIILILVPVGILGDLYESCYKRASGLKDSGSLLPGHGGILDRLDALLFAIPCFVLLLTVFLK